MTHFFPLTNLLTRLGAQEHVPLAPFCTLNVGGPARFFVKPNSISDLAELQLACLESNTPLHILSGGSNTLFSDAGFAGVVVKLSPTFDHIDVASDGLSMTVGAAASYAKVTKIAIAHGWHCAPGWVGTPGLMGGAIRMNAGTRRGEIGEAIAEVHGILNGKAVIYPASQIEFSYRKSTLPSELIIHTAKLTCNKSSITSPDLLLAEVKAYQSKRKLTQPTLNSAGSFFKNPPGTFAGKAIEDCGLKGLRFGCAQVSPLHANFIVNTGSATALDITSLAAIVQTRVLEQLGIKLELEIRTAGFALEGKVS